MPQILMGQQNSKSLWVQIGLLLLSLVFVLLQVSGCSSLSKKPAPMDESTDLVSVGTTIELARAAFTAGCVRTYIAKNEKGHFEACRAAADKYVQEEVNGIIRGPVSSPNH